MKIKDRERKRSWFVRNYYPNAMKGGTKENYKNIEDV
jgi:hypothetical protein